MSSPGSGRLVASAYSPSSREAAAIASWSRAPVIQGLPGPGAGADGDQVLDVAGEDLRDPGVDLFPGLVVAAAEPVADAGQGCFGRGQGALAGGGDGGGLLGGPDVGRPQVVAGAGVFAGDREGTQQALPGGALAGRQPPLPPGQVVQPFQRGQAAARAGIGIEPCHPAGIGAQRDHEPHAGVVGGAQVLQVAQAGVGDHDQAWRQRRGQRLDRGHERRRLTRRPVVRPEVQRHPGGAVACRVLTCRPMLRSAAQPFSTRAEAG